MCVKKKVCEEQRDGLKEAKGKCELCFASEFSSTRIGTKVNLIQCLMFSLAMIGVDRSIDRCVLVNEFNSIQFNVLDTQRQTSERKYKFTIYIVNTNSFVHALPLCPATTLQEINIKKNYRFTNPINKKCCWFFFSLGRIILHRKQTHIEKI